MFGINKFFFGCLISLLVCFTALPSWAAISFVQVTDGTLAHSISSQTTSVTIPSCTNCILVACAVSVHSNSNANVVTGVTFNGTAFTQGAVSAFNSTTPRRMTTQIWYLVNPTVTTANAITTWTNSDNDRFAVSSFLLFDGVDQTTPIDASTNGTGVNATSVSDNITTVTADAWIMDCAVGLDDAGLTVGSGQTVRIDRVGGTGGVFESQGASTVDGKATPGTEAMDWTQAGALGLINSMVALRPFVSGGATCKGGLMLLGVGGC